MKNYSGGRVLHRCSVRRKTMKTQSTNRVVSLLLALFMLLTCVPLTFMATNTTARAEGNTYVLESKDLALVAAGEKADGDSEKAGTDKYFTVYYSAKTKIDSNSKKFDDDYESGQRINSSAAAAVGKDSIGFTTSGEATVKIWWVKNSDNDREMVILDSAGNQVDITSEKAAANTLHINTLKVPAAGTYYLGSTNGGNYIFKVEVTESAAAAEYVFESKDLPEFAAGAKADGDSEKAGTDGFFTVYYSAKTKVDSNSKKFEDDYESGRRLNSSAAAAVGKDSIGFTVPGEATVKIWWVKNSDNDREMVILDSAGNQVDITSEKAAANTLHISTLKVSAAGTYYLGSTNGGNYIFKVSVTTGGGAVVRGDWSAVAAPRIVTLAQKTDANGVETNQIVVTVEAVVGKDGGDTVIGYMCDKDGNVLETQRSLGEKTSHDLTFTPTASGDYFFMPSLSRDGESDEKDGEIVGIHFTLPLVKPTIASVTSKGNGTVEIVINAVDEATGYNVYVDGELQGTTPTTTNLLQGFTVGSRFSITVSAVRGSEEGPISDPKEGLATQEAQQTWGSVFYGSAVSAQNDYVVGDLNEDGKVQVVGANGGGKFNEKSVDGVIFYYTAVPTNVNFTLRAKVHIDTFEYAGGQEGTAVMAIDSLPEKPNSGTYHWTNTFRVGAMDFSYRVDDIKYQMNVGLGYHTKGGITPENLADVTLTPDLINYEYGGLEQIAAENDTKKEGDVTTTLFGNCSTPDKIPNPLPESATLTDFLLEIQRNNTGYRLSWYTADGKLVNYKQFYEPDALDKLDKDYVYVGFASARNMTATYSIDEFTTIDPKDDAPAEARPVTKIDPKVTVKAGDSANSSKYKLYFKANVVGTADVKAGGKTIVSGVKLDGSDEYVYVWVPVEAGSNKIDVVFTPSKNQVLPEFTELSSYNAVTSSKTVEYNTAYKDLETIVVSPDGKSDGKGTKDSPLDIYTAVKVAAPGQTICLLEGTYKLSETLTINRGANGTSEKMITMTADPDAKTRPVLDFQGKANMALVGDYWHLYGFDVTNSKNGAPGMYVHGSYNIVERIEAYKNADCGIYLRSEFTEDSRSIWPKYNLILNCTSYDNADPSGENADGFAAKFAIGVGNVFDGCVAHHNCDDGWDLYERGVTTESILLKNCVAYENGHNLDGSIKGNGNGFKMGGENMPGGHILVNCYAFNNDAYGITNNNCPDVKFYNSTSYNNGKANFNLSTGYANSDYVVSGIISFRDSNSKSQVADSLTPTGTQDLSKMNQANNYTWDGTKSANPAGTALGADIFASTEFKGVNRKADGSIDLGDFLKLTDKAPADAGARDGADAGYDYSPVVDKDNPATGVDYTFVVALISLAGAAVLVLFIKKRRA